MKARPSLQFYPSDWLRDPGLRSCSLTARGLWIDSISFMHEGEPYGHLTLNGHDIEPATLARMVGSPLRDVQHALVELETAGVFSRTEKGTIFSRRMVRDEAVRVKRAEGGRLSLNHPDVPRRKDRGKDMVKDTLPPSFSGSFEGSPSSSSSSSERKEEEKRAGSASPSPASVGRSKLTDAEFIEQLRQNPAYQHLNVDSELGKLDAWLLTPRGAGKKKTRQRIVTWLNRAADEQRPVASSIQLVTGCVEKIDDGTGRGYVDCEGPVAPNQSLPIRQLCVEHLSRRLQLEKHIANGRSS